MSDIATLSSIALKTPNLDRPPVSSDKKDRELKAACSGLESIFIYYLIKEMRATIPKSGFISRGKGEEIYSSMLDSHLAKELSSKGGIGLYSILLKQLENRPENNEGEKIKKLIK